MDKQVLDATVDGSTTTGIASERPAYETPSVTVMDEADVLKTFQFTSAAITWWVM